MNILLPPGLPAERVIARIGLISDTHMPERCTTLPSAIFEVFRDVDLILHAGDVGELWVLDQLSTIAPIVAVHGNDDAPAAIQELPYHQLITIAKQRILLWHSHFRDRAAEMASRVNDAWPPKLGHRANWGRRVEARIVVFGHTHIPMTYKKGDILLANPGAIASGNHFTRQCRQTVALLFIRDDGMPLISHVDLAIPYQIYVPNIDWTAGFKAALGQFSETIIAPDLVNDIAVLKNLIFSDSRLLQDLFLRIAHRCWSGEQNCITRVDLLTEIQQDSKISPADKIKIQSALE